MNKEQKYRIVIRELLQIIEDMLIEDDKIEESQK
jgi:hypothetical protein